MKRETIKEKVFNSDNYISFENGEFVFVDCSFTNIQLNNLSFKSNKFINCCFTDIKFENCLLTNCYFENCDLQRVVFETSNLENSYFYESKIEKSSVHFCNMNCSEFLNCSLKNTKFFSSVLFNTFWDSVDFTKVLVVDCITTELELINPINLVWTRELIGEILLQETNGLLERQKIALLVKHTKEFCWEEWRKYSEDINVVQINWVNTVFKKYPNSKLYEVLNKKIAFNI